MAQVFDNGTKLVFLTAVTDTKDSDVEGVGAIRQEGDKFYRWVKNTEGSAALRVGAPVCYDLSDNETLHEGVLSPVTADLAFLAGIAVSAIPAGEWGWILIEGWYDDAYVQNSGSAVTFAAGDILAGTNGVSALVQHKVAAGLSAVANHGYMIAMESRASVSNATMTASGSGATADVWVHCRNV